MLKREMPVGEWSRVCAVQDTPGPGEATEFEVKGVTRCVANRDGRFLILENECPHRGGPLGQGWIEGNAVLCPWHAWAFDLETGKVEAPEHGGVEVFPTRIAEDHLEMYTE